MNDLQGALQEGVDIPCTAVRKKMSWLEFALDPFPDIFGPNKGACKVKDAFLHEPYSDEQIKTAYRVLTCSPETPGVFIGLATYGCQVNAVSPELTATIQRSAIMTTSCTAGWAEPADEEKNLHWARTAYAALFAETGAYRCQMAKPVDA